MSPPLRLQQQVLALDSEEVLRLQEQVQAAQEQVLLPEV
jgi:hypothetical protein